MGCKDTQSSKQRVIWEYYILVKPPLLTYKHHFFAGLRVFLMLKNGIIEISWFLLGGSEIKYIVEDEQRV